MRAIHVWLIGFALAFLVGSALANNAYQFLNEIPIGGEGGWDILTIDSSANRLYLSHATKVVVVDLNKNAVVGEIAETPGVHAFVAVPEFQRGFSSNGKEAKLGVVDLTTLKTISKIDTGQNPDAIVYEPHHHEVYVFNHTGNSVTVIDAKSATTTAKEETPQKLTVVQTLKTERGARTMALDPKTHRIYLPTAQFQPAPSPSPGASPARPTIVPNTLKLLVYGPSEQAKH